MMVHCSRHADGRRVVNGNDFLHAFNEKNSSSMVAKIKKINENLEKGIHNKKKEK